MLAREKAASLEVNVTHAREERDVWVNRFDTENKDHMNTANMLGVARVELKDC